MKTNVNKAKLLNLVQGSKPFSSWDSIGAEECNSCKSGENVEIAPTLAIRGVGTAENDHCEVRSLSAYRSARFRSPRAWASTSATKIRIIQIRHQK